jgi:hypothetical protein
MTVRLGGRDHRLDQRAAALLGSGSYEIPTSVPTSPV